MYATNVPDKELLERLGVALKAAAYYRTMTAEDIAAEVGVARGTVYRWMRGENGMSLEEAIAVARALNAPGDLLSRPADSRERALVMMAAWDELRRSAEPPDPWQP